MPKLLFIVLILGLGAWIIRQIFPDFQRYMRLRSM